MPVGKRGELKLSPLKGQLTSTNKKRRYQKELKHQKLIKINGEGHIVPRIQGKEPQDHRTVGITPLAM